MSDWTFVEPGRTGKWKIMINENGRERHLNDGATEEEATAKAQKAATKRGIEFRGEGTAPAAPAEEVIPAKEVVGPNLPKWFSQPRPKGAPALGDFVTFTAPDGGQKEMLVVDYLAEQFVGQIEGGYLQAVHVTEDWKIS